MAISPIGSADTGGSVNEDVTITRSWTSTTGTNSCMVVFIPYYAPGSAASVSGTPTWGGTNLSVISGTSGLGDYGSVILVGALGASHAGATNTLSVTFNSNVYALAIIQQFDGCHQTTPAHDGTATTSATESGTASRTVANVATTDYVIGTFAKADGANAYTWGTETQLAQLVHPGLTTRRMTAAYRTGVSGSVVFDATFSSTYWGGSAAALQEAGGGGRTTKNTRSAPLGLEVGMNWRGNL